MKRLDCAFVKDKTGVHQAGCEIRQDLLFVPSAMDLTLTVHGQVGPEKVLQASRCIWRQDGRDRAGPAEEVILDLLLRFDLLSDVLELAIIDFQGVVNFAQFVVTIVHCCELLFVLSALFLEFCLGGALLFYFVRERVLFASQRSDLVVRFTDPNFQILVFRLGATALSLQRIGITSLLSCFVFRAF